MSFLDRLDQRYRVILCDVWGCLHDGRRLYPGAAERLRQWRGEKRQVVLISNAPRMAATVAAHLQRFGLSPGDWDHVVTAGEAGISALRDIAAPVGFIGTAGDRAELKAAGIAIAEDRRFDHLACAGLDELRGRAGDYRSEFEQMAARGVVMHCLNPDRIVVSGGVTYECAGSLADLYEALGGQVFWYGKPYPAIYRHALALVGGPQPSEVLAIGDGLATDVLGAARMGMDCVFVTGGIHAGQPVPPGFAAENQLGDWRPVAVVDSLR